ncbi:UDP-glycosyltransferase UGT5-like [Chironomus tepperi]|uniref:UDP-glycosyltransferase UGT5-like n=1 Tax=Chironomus tepperi TaxID=113505 RepID=UPI00391EED2B
MNFVIFCSFFAAVQSANILGIFPYPYFSHQKFHHAIMKVLIEQGHNVTIFTTHPQDYSDNPNVTQHIFAETVQIHLKYTDMLMYKQKKLHWSQILMQYEIRAFYESSIKEMEHPEMQKLIHNSSDYKFDLIISECIMCPFLLLAEVFDCPIALVASSDAPAMIHGMFGNDVNPLKYSESLALPYVHGQMSIFEQLNSLIFQTFYEFIFNFAFFYYNGKLNIQHFGHLGWKTVKSPTDRLALLLTNTNQAFGHIRPLMPSTVQVGYLHVEKPKEIADEELRNFLDSSENGVIVMALGSRADPKSLGIDNVKKFMSAFNQTSMNVIWKLHEIDDGLEVPHNVEIVSWLPLADVLAHPNVKLLIFHGGLLTSYEAIDRAVPMIVFPLAYDQFMNARLMARNGIAMEMDLNDFDGLRLGSAIQEMTKAEYLKNIEKMRRFAYNQPISSKELTIWHVENAVRNRFVYAKDFGCMSIWESRSMHLVLYAVGFIGSMYILVRKKLMKIPENSG